VEPDSACGIIRIRDAKPVTLSKAIDRSPGTSRIEAGIFCIRNEERRLAAAH
jgi:hypothetical protein